VKKVCLLFAALVLTCSVASGQVPSHWFAFRPDEDFSPSVIDTSDWLDAPAGKHGYVQIQEDRFVFEDGTPVKFWGSNICDARPGSDRQTADRWARRLAKYGVNCIRFHKWTDFGEAVAKGGPSTALDPEFMDRMDYFVAQLRERGIYYGWSHIYGHRVSPADRSRLLAYDEVADRSTTGLVNFAPDLQELNIELTRNLLNHRNPYTGLTYAEDPALAFIEFQNEDDIFFGSTKSAVDACPTYRKLFCSQFSRWLKDKYGSHQALAEAWGEKAFDNGEYQKGVTEHLDRENIYPVAHPWWYGSDGLRIKADQRRRLLDTARFLYETQNKFYDRFTQAIRATGYRGPLVGSCWQAGSGVSHLYNLHSDARVGIVDRHNYFGGGTGHRLREGKVKTGAMVSEPGSGLLGSGRQQVEGRPFALSEWMSLIPNQCVAEGPPLIAVYGLGLQGWDASYSFGTNYDHFTPTIQAPWVYNADSPTQMSQYPALARMLYRGDVEEGAAAAVRKVHIPGLREGKLGFSEEVVQEGDVKTFGGQTPSEALAVGRVLVRFCEEPQPYEQIDFDRCWDRDAKRIISTTGQLSWDYSGHGYFTVDTPGTQAVVGFSGGKRIELGDVLIEPRTPFQSLFVTSLDREKPISESRSLLVTAVARARNSGMRYNRSETEVLDVGEAPIMLEPVEAAITIKGRGKPTVHVLDHVGRRTRVRASVSAHEGDATFHIGRGYRTIYYEVAF
jgi:hypothetical protein